MIRSVVVRTDHMKRAFLFLFALQVAFGAAAHARQVLQDRIPKAVKALNLQPVGRVPATQRLNLAIGLPVRNTEALTAFLRDLYDPASPRYRRFLTPAQFAEKFGPTQQDYDAAIEFAKANGLDVAATSPSRMVLSVSGPASAIEKTFHMKLQTYRHPKESRQFYAPDVEPSLDLSVPVLNVEGLNNYALPHPRSRIQKLSSASTWNGYIGGDFRKAYVLGTTLTGVGESVGLVAFDSYYPSDILQYEAEAGLPNVTLTNIAVDGGVSRPHSGNGEVALDIQMAIAMAPGLSSVAVYITPQSAPWADVLSRMADDNLARQLSCSWGGGPPDAICEQIFQQMAAQGQTFFSASGDNNSFGSQIGFPSESPNITQVGGTILNTDASGRYSFETVWNLNITTGSGGGISVTYPIPDYQADVDMSYNQGSTTMRNMPDVALIADDVYNISDNGYGSIVAGTSCAAPLWAGFIALVNQQAAEQNLPPVGFLNPALYFIGNNSQYHSCFHDITTGHNFSYDNPYRYSAVLGYDLCTGWGTPNGTNLINALIGFVGGQPAIITGPTLTNALWQVGNTPIVLAGQTNVFAVAAFVPNGNPAAYLWDFGDGGTSTNPTAEHAYSATNCGSYPATVTISSGEYSTQGSLTVSVPCEMGVSKLNLKLNFAKPNSDNCAVTGSINLPVGFYPLNAQVGIDVAGAQNVFTLNKQGSGKNGTGNCKLSYNRLTGTWTVKAKLKKGSWQTQWAASGLTDSNVPKPGTDVSLPVIIVVNSNSFMTTTNLHYTATSGKSGIAR
jgi:subtilase family serine protease